MSSNAGLPPGFQRTLYLATRAACTDASMLLQERAGASNLLGCADADALDDSARSRLTVSSLVLETVFSAIQDYARDENSAHSPASRLPPEILCSIFARLPFAGRIWTSHVCHAWRTASLEFPVELWSVIPPTRRLDTMGPLLERTRTRNVPIELTGVTLKALRRVSSSCVMIKAHMAHTRVLVLRVEDCALNRRGQLAAALNMPAPMLRYFCLEDNDKLPPLPFERGIFGKHAPLLERLTIRKGAKQYLSSFSAFPTILTVKLEYIATGSPLDPAWSTLLGFPSITALELYTLGGGSLIPDSIRLPRTITRLKLFVTDIAELATFDMEHINTIPNVHIVCRCATLPPATIEAFLPVALRAHAMEAVLDSGRLEFRVRDSSSTLVRSFSNIEPTTLLGESLWESTYGSVANLKLYICDSLLRWLRINASPCPNIEHLTVAHKIWDELEGPGRLISDFSRVGLTVPRLQTLTLLAPSSSGSTRPIVDAQALIKFVSSLHLTAPKLALLCLRGIALSSSGKSKLDGIADIVRLEPEGIAQFPNLWKDD
ncbi:hypothetical protein EXIGLDRAFT_727649 [Exidia glandulosa HHB12029]|uniref:F-box domain-containing protein n=1 Tax=Exidia glandulosa HHB12029 TaxID=1314781 RepID=A0A165M034_EXIGL|nr:hypothetical protein EXIGLDRAFT_727649 [Exidia glandulosa HHB12029]